MFATALALLFLVKLFLKTNFYAPFRLLWLVLYNNNEIQEQNQIKNVKSSLHSL